MAKYIFQKLKDEENRFDKSTVNFEVEAVTYVELLEEFEHFLRASGFRFDGRVEIVPEDEE